MMRDIERVVIEPSDEDHHWFPEIAGSGDAMAVLRDIWENYRDESFISQFLSPCLIRQMRMFQLHDDPANSEGVRVDAIHDERGYQRIRRKLARCHDVGYLVVFLLLAGGLGWSWPAELYVRLVPLSKELDSLDDRILVATSIEDEEDWLFFCQ